MAWYEYKTKYTKAYACEEKYKCHKRRAHAIVYGQCSEGLRAKLHSTKDFIQIEEEQEMTKFLLLIHLIISQFNNQTQGMYVRVQAVKQAFLFMQKRDQTIKKYIKDLLATMDTMNSHEG